MKTLTIIDTFGFFFRGYHALPKLTNKDGFPTGLLTGFLNFIMDLEKSYKSEYIIFALDSKGKTFRHEIDEKYKANRPEAPEDLKQQLPVAIEWIKQMGFSALEVSGYEADDVIASAVKFLKLYDVKVRIVTHDKDLYQLIEDEKVSIFSPMKKVDIDTKGCVEKFGVKPSQVRDYLSLVGDASDNIPGVKGIGTKGAQKLLNEFHDIENIYNSLDKISNKRTKILLEEGKESAFMSKELTSLYYDLDIFKDLDEFIFPAGNPLIKIKDELKKYDFSRILSKLQTTNIFESVSANEENKVEAKEALVPKAKKEFEAILLDTKEKLFDVVDKLKSSDIVAFDTETNSLHVKKAKLIGFSFCVNEQEAYYIPIAHNYLGVTEQISLEDAKKAVEKIFTCKVVGQNIKFDFHIIKNNLNLTPPIPHADTMVLGWLLNSVGKVGLDFMAKKFFGYSMKPFKQMVGRGQNFSHVDIKEACFYAAEDAWMTLKLFYKFENLLEPTLFNEAKEIENSFINILFEMEQVGIKVDTKLLQNLLTRTNDSLSVLTKEIFELTNSEFNINSVKQLGSVLFEKLQLPPSKKTKTGYSTDENVLNSLKDDHEVIPKILEYREFYKLKSTYFEPLIKLGFEDENRRVYTSFLQTGTSTGRLASREPNLQNIPVKTELGREVREGFVAKSGYKLVGLDYSQIELRLLAHFSQDLDMVKAFCEDKDIHLETAIKIFGEEEAKAKRNIAKSINFGLLYGMGARKLGQTLGIPSKEAKSYIDEYFASFKTIKTFIQNTQQKTKEDGYIETLLKRRRYFDYSKATPMLLATYDRECVNTLFQGSAADLIKLAMLKFGKDCTNRYDARLLLQIHDELIFEVKEENTKEFSHFAKGIMENIYKLNIPLKTSVSIGENWSELK